MKGKYSLERLRSNTMTGLETYEYRMPKAKTVVSYDRCPIGVVLPTDRVTVPNRYSSPNHSGGTLSRWIGYF